MYSCAMKSTLTVHQQTPYSTPYSTVVCEDSEYSRVHSEYIDDTLEYYVLCKVRRVQSEYTQTTSEYYVLCKEYGVLCSEHGVLCTVRPTPPPPSTHLSSLPSAPSCQPSAVRTQHSALSTQQALSPHQRCSSRFERGSSSEHYCQKSPCYHHAGTLRAWSFPSSHRFELTDAGCGVGRFGFEAGR